MLFNSSDTIAGASTFTWSGTVLSVGNTNISSGIIEPAISTPIILRTFTADQSTSIQVKNSSNEFIMSMTGDRRINVGVVETAKLRIYDSSTFAVGTADDFTIVHDGTDTSITSGTGALNIVNSNATGNTVFKLGDAAGATSLVVTDSADASVFDLDSDGALTSIVSVTASGAVQGGSITDGTATLSSGSLTGATDITAATYSTSGKGSVTQVTSASTGVTVNAASGKITTVSLTMASAGSETFTVTNSSVAATNIVLANVTSYTGTGHVAASVHNITAGAFDLVIINTSGSTLDSTVEVSFIVI